MPRDAALFDVPGERRRASSAVCQGVRKSIHALFPEDADEETLDRKRRLSGTIAQALSLAASIDRVSGAGDPSRQANGVPLSAMHTQLDLLLLRLDPAEADSSDGFADLERAMREEDERAIARAAAAAAPDARP